MAEITIWNLALSRLGDEATVASPTEHSRQAELCRQFYASARDKLLELHDWGFASRRAILTPAPDASVWPSWAYAYVVPADAIRVFQVGLETTATAVTHTDAALRIPLSSTDFASPTATEDFEIESAADGTRIIYSNVQNATCRYTALVTDDTKFSPLFVDALSYLLASNLAGPILKGETGRQESRALLQEFALSLNAAKTSDARQRRDTGFREGHTPEWLRAR